MNEQTTASASVEAPASKRSNRKRNALVFGAVALVWLALDVLTKGWVAGNYAQGEVITEPILGLVRFHLVHNTGAAWGMFGDSTFLLGVMSLVVCAALVVYLFALSPKAGVIETVGIALVVAVTLLSPAAGTGIDVAAGSLDAGLVAYVFFAAMVAISAMVLPGISGSTLLLIFGLYVPIMGAVRAVMGLDLAYLPILVVFAAGVACGVLLFVRLIRLCLARFRSQTIYAIIGMMAGSLFSITQGPLTLSVPQPAMGIGSFDLVFFLVGGIVVGGLQLLRTRLEEPEPSNENERTEARESA